MSIRFNFSIREKTRASIANTMESLKTSACKWECQWRIQSIIQCFQKKRCVSILDSPRSSFYCFTLPFFFCQLKVAVSIFPTDAPTAEILATLASNAHFELCIKLKSEYPGGINVGNNPDDRTCTQAFVNTEDSCYNLSKFVDISLSFECDGYHQLLVILKHLPGVEVSGSNSAAGRELTQEKIVFQTVF